MSSLSTTELGIDPADLGIESAPVKAPTNYIALNFKSPDYDPRRTDYIEGSSITPENIRLATLTDPKTGEIVRSLPGMEGGALGLVDYLNALFDRFEQGGAEIGAKDIGDLKTAITQHGSANHLPDPSVRGAIELLDARVDYHNASLAQKEMRDKDFEKARKAKKKFDELKGMIDAQGERALIEGTPDYATVVAIETTLEAEKFFSRNKDDQKAIKAAVETPLKNGGMSQREFNRYWTLAERMLIVHGEAGAKGPRVITEHQESAIAVGAEAGKIFNDILGSIFKGLSK